MGAPNGHRKFFSLGGASGRANGNGSGSQPHSSSSSPKRKNGGLPFSPSSSSSRRNGSHDAHGGAAYALLPGPGGRSSGSSSLSDDADVWGDARGALHGANGLGGSNPIAAKLRGRWRRRYACVGLLGLAVIASTYAGWHSRDTIRTSVHHGYNKALEYYDSIKTKPGFGFGPPPTAPGVSLDSLESCVWGRAPWPNSPYPNFDDMGAPAPPTSDDASSNEVAAAQVAAAAADSNDVGGNTGKDGVKVKEAPTGGMPVGVCSGQLQNQVAGGERDMLARHLGLATDFDRNSLVLSREQCDAAFAPLFEPLRQNVRYFLDSPAGNFTYDQLEQGCRQDQPGRHARVVVHGGHLYIKWFKTLNSRTEAALAQLNQALMAMQGEPLPTLEFCLSLADAGQKGTWSLSKQKIPEHDGVWLMPDYAFWSWPEPGIGSYEDVRKETWTMEYQIRKFSAKKQQIFWRGAINDRVGAADRKAMAQAAANQSWADIDRIVWEGNDGKAPPHSITMADHCKYAFLAHPEGATYSGRLKYIQNCHSVILTHEPKFFQHWTHLYNGNESSPLQNIVILPSNNHEEPWDAWQRMPERMQALTGPERSKARAIADRSWEAYRERWLSPAATACYWRELLRSFAQVQGYEAKLTCNETSYESFMIQGYKLKQEVPIH